MLPHLPLTTIIAMLLLNTTPAAAVKGNQFPNTQISVPYPHSPTASPTPPHQRANRPVDLYQPPKNRQDIQSPLAKRAVERSDPPR
jgi:hypothetical protein